MIRGPNRKLIIDPAVLANYAGRFQIEDGLLAEFRVSDGRLLLKVNDDESELLPVTESMFYIERNNFTLEFLRDDSGKFNELWGWNGTEFTGTRVP